MSHYFSDLDSVRFDSAVADAVLEERVLRATSDLMSVLIALETPVLSQTQVFDSPFLLEAVAAGTADSDAILALVRQSRIQMRAFRPADAVPLLGTGEHVLLEVFLDRVRHPSFVFTAWPELNGDDELRRLVVAHTLGQTTESPGPVLAQRLEGLERLNDAFVRSHASEEARTSSMSLGAEIADHLGTASGVGYLRGTYAKLMELHRHYPSGGFDLETRSGWYKLITAYADDARLSAEHGHLAGVRRVVDLHYNRKVADSVGASRLEENEEDARTAEVLRSAPTTLDFTEEKVLVMEGSDVQDWLTWANLTTRMDELGLLQDEIGTPGLRRRGRRVLIESLDEDRLALQPEGSRPVLFVRSARRLVQTAAPTAAGGAAAVAATVLAGPHPAIALAGVVVGALVDKGLSRRLEVGGRSVKRRRASARARTRVRR